MTKKKSPVKATQSPAKPIPATSSPPITTPPNPIDKFRKPTKIAILGNAGPSLTGAPYGDPSWQIWDMSNNWKYKKRFDLWFEMHTVETLKAYGCHDEYVKFLGDAGKKLVCGWPSDKWPQANLFPLRQIIETFGTDYFTCSCAYMIAYAMLLKTLDPASVTEIGLWGIDMAVGEEYSHQKPCVEFWVGKASMMMPVTIADESPVCRTNGMYAFDNPKLSREFTDRMMDLKRQLADTATVIRNMEIALQVKKDEQQQLIGAENAIRQLCHRWAL